MAGSENLQAVRVEIARDFTVLLLVDDLLAEARRLPEDRETDRRAQDERGDERQPAVIAARGGLEIRRNSGHSAQVHWNL